MTEVRTFKAGNMQEALDLVRRELGAEAVILHTRQTTKRRILPWAKSGQEVEITAGLGVNVRPSSAKLREARDAETQVDSLKTNGHAAAESASSLPFSTDKPSFLQNLAESGVELDLKHSGHDGSDPTAHSGNIPRENATRISAVSQPTPSYHQGETEHPLSDKLDSIQKMVESLGRHRHMGGQDEIPTELFHLYTELIDADVEDELARDLIFRLRQNCTAEQLTDSVASKAILSAMVESEIQCAPPISSKSGQRKVVALVGPTGVGKTTTIAKLAANFRLRDGIRMGLVTVDTYRIAAVEQLRTYAEIIDLPMKVVTSPLEMRRAMDELVGMDLVLIDTAGRSPRDELKIQELKSLLAEAEVDEVHLVMSLTASLRSIEATANKFTAANTTSLILTKLDEAAGMGSLLSVARAVPMPISYLTTGQDVPEDIEPANSSRMSRLVLGQDRLFY